MGQAPQQLAVSDTKAAKMLDMPATEFRRLVGVGALPAPVRIGEYERWSVAQIEAILSGQACRPKDEDFEL